MVSIKDFEEEIRGSIPLTVTSRMNIYTFDIFTNHCMDVEEYEEPGIRGLKFHYLTTGPLNLPESSHIAIVKEAIRIISSLSISLYHYLKLVNWILIMGRLLWNSAVRNKASNTHSCVGGKQKIGENFKWILLDRSCE